MNDKEPYPTYYATKPRPAPTQTSAELYAAADAADAAWHAANLELSKLPRF